MPFIQEQLEALLKQDYNGAWELIIVTMVRPMKQSSARATGRNHSSRSWLLTCPIVPVRVTGEMSEPRSPNGSLLRSGTQMMLSNANGEVRWRWSGVSCQPCNR